jgi:hypothetical protein
MSVSLASCIYEKSFARYDIGCALAAAGSPLAASPARDQWQAASGQGAWVVFSRPAQEERLVRAATPLVSE